MSQYEALDMTEIGVEVERVNKKDGGNFLDQFVKLPSEDGFVALRILPRRKGQQLYCATRTHRLGHGDEARSYHCPRELIKTPNGQFWVATEEHGDCIICRYYKNMWQKSLKLSGKAQADLQAAARLIKPVERFYYNVIARTQFDTKTNKIQTDVGPMIYSCGKTVHSMILTGITGDVKAGKKPKGDITDPHTGRDFRLVKTMTRGANGMVYPSYDKSEFEEPSPAGTPEQFAQWMDNLHDLTKLRTLKDEATLSHALKVHLGIEQADNKQADEDWSEFEGGSTKVSASVPQEIQDVIGDTKPVTKQEKKPAAAPAVNEDQILADPAFMAEIDNLNADD